MYESTLSNLRLLVVVERNYNMTPHNYSCMQSSPTYLYFLNQGALYIVKFTALMTSINALFKLVSIEIHTVSHRLNNIYQISMII